MKNKTLLWIVLLAVLGSFASAGPTAVVTQTACDSMNNLGAGIGNNHGTSFIFKGTYAGATFTKWTIWIANNSYAAGQFLEVRCCTGETVCGGTGNAFMQNYTLPSISTTATCGGATLYNLSLNWIPTQNGNYTCMARQTGASGALYMGQWSSASVYNNGKLLHNGAFFPAAENTFIIWQDTENFTMTATDVYTGSTLTTFNATINGTDYGTTASTINTTIPQDTGLVNITLVNATNYFTNSTLNYNTSANYQANLTPYTQITVYSLSGGTALQNFSLNFTNSTASYTTSTQNGVIHLPIYNEEWNLTVYDINHNGVNYAMDEAQVNGTPFVRNYTFYVYTSNSYNITFRDERNNSIVYTENSTSENIVVDFLGDLLSYSYTSNGTLYVDLLTPQDYLIRYYKHNGTTYGRIREYYVTLVNQSITNLDLYLIPTTVSSSLTITVYNANSLQPLNSRVVYLQRFNVTSNAYFTVAMSTTDVAGQAYFDVEQQNELYRFQIDSPWGTTVFLSNPLYIESSEINLYVNTAANFADLFFNTENITGIILYSNSTGTPTLTASYTDTQMLATLYCFEIKKWTRYTKEKINGSCSTSASGAISLTGLDPGETYYGLFTALINGENRTLKAGWKDIPSTALGGAELGIFLTWGLFVTFVFLISLHFYAAIIGTVSLLFAKLIGILPVDWGYVIILFIASIFLTVLLHRRR